MAEPSINQAIADALVRQDLRARRVETDLRRQVLAALAVLEADILAALKVADPTDFALLSRRRREVETLMREAIDPLVTERYRHIAALLDAALVRLAHHEAGAVQDVVNEVSGEEVVEDLPSDRQLRAGVTQSLFPSASKPTDLSTTGADWWTRQGQSLRMRIGDSLLVGVSLGESLTELATRLKGTADAAFTDGLMGKARSDAQRLVTTHVTNTLGEARAAVGLANASQVVLEHSALLEAKPPPCLVCLARHGKRFTADADHTPIGHSLPYLSGVPYHPSCRCSMLTVLRTGGAVAQETTTQWLTRQSTAVQDEVLGPTRARLFREGKLSPTNLIDALTGRPLTLEELGV